MVALVSHDSSPPSLPAEALSGFAFASRAFDTGVVPREGSACAPSFFIEPAAPVRDDVAALGCSDVVGFDEAVVAAEDPYAETPARVALVGLDEPASSWVADWAEDVEQVRRSLTIRRADGVEVTMVATLAAFGAMVPTSLAVESIRARACRAILRSGVHPRAEVDAALGVHFATVPDEGSAPMPPA
jgi:hypothetical protein